jgi:hypothetical protein
MIPKFVEFVEGFAERASISEGTESGGINADSTMYEVLARMGLDCLKQEDWDEFLEAFRNDNPGRTAQGNRDLCGVTLRDWLTM